LAAALRFVDDPLADEALVRDGLVERLLLAVERLLLAVERLLLAVERLLLAVERLLLAAEPLLLADERPLAADERLLLADERLEPLDFFAPARELPLLRRSAMWSPPRSRYLWV
jgi:hypothetical protein